jgi:hypothetical protein
MTEKPKYMRGVSTFEAHEDLQASPAASCQMTGSFTLIYLAKGTVLYTRESEWVALK